MTLCQIISKKLHSDSVRHNYIRPNTLHKAKVFISNKGLDKLMTVSYNLN